MKNILLLLIANLFLISCDSKSNISSFKIEKPNQTENKIHQTIFVKINTTAESANDRKYELELFCKSLYLDENKKLSWNASKNWKPNKPIAMSIAYFEIDNSTDNIAISAFPGDAGGLEPNVNRWRQQLNLPPININKIKKDIIHSPFFGEYYIFHETNSNNKSIIAAIIPIK